jgi:tetrahydrodipicolinate N-succinyltransferase
VGARATFIPGVTVGLNSVVYAGAMVLNDVPDNCIVGDVGGFGEHCCYYKQYLSIEIVTWCSLHPD